MGKADYYESGGFNAVCYECGRKRKASMLKLHWQGYYVCPEHWEPRQPQDFVRSIPDNMTPPWAQPMPADVFSPSCTPSGSSGVPGLAEPGCAIPNYLSPLFYLEDSSLPSQPALSPAPPTPPVVPDGDHPAGDGLTRLQVAFTGGSSADVSSFALGTGTLVGTGVTINNGYLEIVENGAVDRHLSWADDGLGRQSNGAYTLEFFVEPIAVSPLQPASGIQYAIMDIATGTVMNLYQQGLLGGVNAPAIDWPGLASWGGNYDWFTGTYHHVAIVADTSNNFSFYFDGIRPFGIVTGNYNKNYSGATSAVQLGATGGVGVTTTFRFSGIRVRRAVMYSGASFMPPASPAVWGPP